MAFNKKVIKEVGKVLATIIIIGGAIITVTQNIPIEDQNIIKYKIRKLPSEQKSVAMSIYNDFINGKLDYEDLVYIQARLINAQDYLNSAMNIIRDTAKVSLEDQRRVLNLLINANGEVDKVTQRFKGKAETEKYLTSFRATILETRKQLQKF